MNFKYVLPMMVAATMFACSDDSSSGLDPVNPDPVPASSSAMDPGPLAVSSSAMDPGPLAVSSSAMDPGPLAVSSSAMDPGPVPASSSATASRDSNGTALDPVPPAVYGPYDATKKYTFYGAELTGTDLFTYGRFEARMRMAAASGTVSSMFLNYDLSWKKGEEPWNEIDIEVLGKSKTSWQANLITREPDNGGKANTNITSESIHDFGCDATEGFHLFAIVWTPEYIAWEIDSVEVRRDVVGNPNGLAHDQVAFMTMPQSLRFNLWASKSTGWVGQFKPEDLPVEQHIDYVRAYSYDTATKTFTKLWQDDFDGVWIDQAHWTFGNWEMERVMYRDLNIRVENGLVKLRLDYEE